MSNVLIGIIGVILFIGLALAGALFLGPRFQDSRNTSIAAANVQALQQVVNAVDMYSTMEGSTTGAYVDQTSITTSSGIYAKGYLKAIPSDASGRGATFVPYLFGADRFMLVGLQSKAVCQAVIRQAGGDPSTIPMAPDHTKSLGCYGGGTENQYIIDIPMS